MAWQMDMGWPAEKLGAEKWRAECQRNRHFSLFRSSAVSIDIKKFVGVDEYLDGIAESVLPGVGGEAFQFGRVWLPLKYQSEGGLYLIRDFHFPVSGLRAGYSLGDVLALSDKEGVVEHREGLLCRRRNAAHGRDRAAVGAIQRVHERVGNGAKQESIDGAPE